MKNNRWLKVSLFSLTGVVVLGLVKFIFLSSFAAAPLSNNEQMQGMNQGSQMQGMQMGPGMNQQMMGMGQQMMNNMMNGMR